MQLSGFIGLLMLWVWLIEEEEEEIVQSVLQGIYLEHLYLAEHCFWIQSIEVTDVTV